MHVAPGVAAVVVGGCVAFAAFAQKSETIQLMTVDCSAFEHVAVGYRVVKSTTLVVSIGAQRYEISPRQGDVIEPDTITIGGGSGRSLNLMIAKQCR